MSFTRATRSLAAAALLPLVLTLGACGGGSDDASPTTAGGSGTAAGSASSGDFCTQLKATWGKLSGNSPEQVLAKLQGLAGAAPDQLRSDFDAIVAQQQFLVDHKNDMSSTDEYMKLNAKNLEAMKHVAQYLAQEC